MLQQSRSTRSCAQTISNPSLEFPSLLYTASAALLFYVAVRYIHHVLEAGPLVIITTALVAIFTIGLGDKDEQNDDGISAYSVFNRGFQRLLGSVDADQLLAQHVGGGMGMGMGGFMMGNNGNGGGDGMVMGLQELPNVPRGRRRRANNNAVAEEADPPRAGAGDNDGDDEDQENDENVENYGGNQARPSEKKARRRNLDQRLELRRQREAAAAMGFGVGNAAAEVEAMQRLLDDQVVNIDG